MFNKGGDMNNEILELTEEQLEKIRKQFSTVNKISEEKAVIKDWLDDSVQVVTLKGDKLI
jgi:hypothetical protein